MKNRMMHSCVVMAASVIVVACSWSVHADLGDELFKLVGEGFTPSFA